MNTALPAAAPQRSGSTPAPLQPRFAALGAPFVEPVAATPLPAPQRLWGNAALAAELGLDPRWWRSDAATAVLAGNAPWPGYASQASVYAGHQFGHYTPRLGDGRALLIAELDTAQGPQELQLKGAGPTPYSRGLDGRAVLRSSVRELLACEAMHGLGIPSTRALALVGAPLAVQREATETAAVLCRSAPSFLRFGHFEYFARQAPERLAPLADWVIDHHFPQFSGRPDRHARWLGEVIERSARLVAQWQTVGFVHGVMNTDNCSVLGLTLDYGPYGFMDRFRAHHVANHSDHEGRYAWAAQPAVGRWNVERLLDACWPLLDARREAALEQARALHGRFDPAFDTLVLQRWCAKLGLAAPRAGDGALVSRWLNLLQRGRCDFTASFRALAEGRAAQLRPALAARGAAEAFDAWCADWRARLAQQGEPATASAERMRRANPKYVLRNHLAQAAIAAAERGDPGELRRLARLLETPFDDQLVAAAYAEPPPADAPALELSCSS